MRDTALTNPERSRWIKDFAAVLVMLRDRAREQRTIADQLPIDSIAGRPDNGARHPGTLEVSSYSNASASIAVLEPPIKTGEGADFHAIAEKFDLGQHGVIAVKCALP